MLIEVHVNICGDECLEYQRRNEPTELLMRNSVRLKNNIACPAEEIASHSFISLLGSAVLRNGYC
jgi:hypothetical protein